MGTLHDFPWRLRLEHEGFASVRVERKGRTLRFDPVVPPDGDDIVVLTRAWPEHLDATAQAIAAGVRPTVVAEPEVLSWLSRKGELDGHRAPVTLDGLSIETLAYTPIPYAEGAEALRKVRSALVRPDRAVRRLARRVRQPKAEPVVVQVTLPDGGRLLHLNLALHGGMPDAWLDEAAARFGGADWIVVGIDYGHDDAVLQRIQRFGDGRIMFTDLLNDSRQAVGMPINLLTPACDRAITQGVDAHLFVGGAGMRFE
jgi:hypothetical protein